MYSSRCPPRDSHRCRTGPQPSHPSRRGSTSRNHRPRERTCHRRSHTPRPVCPPIPPRNPRAGTCLSNARRWQVGRFRGPGNRPGPRPCPAPHNRIPSRLPNLGATSHRTAVSTPSSRQLRAARQVPAIPGLSATESRSTAEPLEEARGSVSWRVTPLLIFRDLAGRNARCAPTAHSTINHRNLAGQPRSVPSGRASVHRMAPRPSYLPVEHLDRRADFQVRPSSSEGQDNAIDRAGRTWKSIPLTCRTPGP